MMTERTGRPKDVKRAVAFAVTRKGEEVARRIEAVLPGLVVHGPAATGGGTLASLVRESFSSSDALIFVSATGIAVRMVAPLLAGKEKDPAVVVVDDSARFVVSLLSGHLGGANDLARLIASAIGATPVITTATDSAGLPCVEEIAAAFDLVIEDVSMIKTVNAAILEGGPVMVVDDDGERLSAVELEFGGVGSGDSGGRGVFSFEGTMPKTMKDPPHAVVLISAATKPQATKWAEGRTLVARPREVVAGLGCRRGVTADEVEGAVTEAFAEAGLSILSLRSLATIDIKKDEEGITEYARKAGVEVEYYPAEDLANVPPPSGGSERVREATGTPGVSEPAALLSSGADRLWMKKKVKGNVTVALARAV